MNPPRTYWMIIGSVLALAPGMAATGEPDPPAAPQTITDIVPEGTAYRVLGAGYGFCEGPAADAQGNVYFSDGKRDSIYFYEIGKPVQRWVADSTDANGMMFNSKGELLVCEGAAFRVVAFNIKTKEKRPLIGKFEDERFNEPNDLTVDGQDGFYFTDPNYRHRGQETVRSQDAYYVSAKGEISRVSNICVKPNGIHLTPDGKTLYLADNGGKVVYRYDVTAPGKLANQLLWVELGAGPDGMTLDSFGNVYVACGGAGILVYTPEGKKLGVIEVPYASNVVFGGPDFRTLFVTSRDQFLALPTRVEGIRPPCAK